MGPALGYEAWDVTQGSSLGVLQCGVSEFGRMTGEEPHRTSWAFVKPVLRKQDLFLSGLREQTLDV